MENKVLAGGGAVAMLLILIGFLVIFDRETAELSSGDFPEEIQSAAPVHRAIDDTTLEDSSLSPGRWSVERCPWSNYRTGWRR